MSPPRNLRILLIIISIHQISSSSSSSPEYDYLRYVKDGCFIKNEALSCIKYKALKLATQTLLGNGKNLNETIESNYSISLIPLDDRSTDINEFKDDIGGFVIPEEPRGTVFYKVFKQHLRAMEGIMSEWSELARYFMKIVKDFFRVKGLRVMLPDGARTVEEDVDDGRGRRKKLALILPLLTLLATLKTKVLLIPILLAVMLIKKLLLIAALLVPSILNTLKHCKHPPHFSVFGSSDVSDFSSDYGANYAYSSGAGYGKDWAANRAYNMQKYRPTAAPVYITAPGGTAQI